jgi:2-amino-4-hydroxy-6-hydroxymethyldihydropteridine diphosphokinase
LGQPLQALGRAASLIAELTEIVGHSSVYRSAAMGRVQQPDFFNAAVCVRWSASPARLIAELLGIERRMGRHRAERWGPRTLDLDLLWVEARSLEQRDARVPHPRLLERAFALVPLCEVAPDAREPRSGRPYASLGVSPRGQSLYRVAASHPWAGALRSMDTRPAGW